MKIGGTAFDPCSVFIASCLLRKLLGETILRGCLSRLFSHSAPSHLASVCALGAIRNTGVPKPYCVLTDCGPHLALFGGLGEQRPPASTAYRYRPAGHSHSDRDGGARTS